MAEFAHYNGGAAEAVPLDAGTRLYRVINTDTLATYQPSAFNSTHVMPLQDTRKNPLHLPLDDTVRQQGRFDPVHDDTICPGGASLGGYMYLGLNPAAAFAEGIFRNKKIPASGRISPNWLEGKSIVELKIHDTVSLAPLDKSEPLRRLGMDTGIWGSGWERYYDTRISGTNLLVKNTSLHGIRYPCRHDHDSLAIILVERGDPPLLETISISHLDKSGWGYDLFEETVDRFGWFIGRK